MSARPAPPSLLGNTLGLRSLLVMLYHLLRHMISAVFSGLWPTDKAHDVTAVYGTARPSAVVTGADTGIGQYLSVHLASQGWQVFAGVFTQQGLQELPNLHKNITAIPMDVTKQDTLLAAVQKVSAAVGADGLQLLVNNAGIALLAPVETVALDDFKRVYDVNVFGVVGATQAFLPLLRAGPRPGRVIIIGSAAGHSALPFWTAYCGSKHAVEGVAICLRFELHPQGVAVVLIKPGAVKTAIWEDDADRHLKLLDSLTPEQMELYGKDLKLMIREAQKAHGAAVPIEDAIRVIYEAATCSKPLSKYHVGNVAEISYWIRRLMPDTVYETGFMQLLQEEYSKPDC